MTAVPVRDGAGNTILADETGASKVSRPGLRSVWRTSFSDVLANPGIDDLFKIVCRGAGQTCSQTGGNILITAGTAANEEFIARSKQAFNESFLLKYQVLASQRIINNTFAVELVDVVGDDLPYVINSATSVTVTWPAGTCPFAAKNVGQSMYMGAIRGAAGLPGRYAIASVAGDAVTFTVASWPSTGSGVLNLFGWNYYHVVYDGTTATNAKFDAQRNGYASGDTTATVLTSASPGHIGILKTEDGRASFADMLSASVASTNTGVAMPQETLRATRDVMTADNGVPLYLQLRATNGTTNPASSTTFTVGFVGVYDYTPQAMTLTGLLNSLAGAPLPVIITNQSYSTTVPSLAVVGAFAHDGAMATTNNPVMAGGNARSTNVAATADNDVARFITDLHGRQVIALGNVDQLKDKNRITLTTTTETTLIAAVASVRHVVNKLIIANRDTVACTVDIRDATAGTVRSSIVIPAGQTFVENDVVGDPQNAVNTNWTAQLRAATTTNAVEISVRSYRLGF